MKALLPENEALRLSVLCRDGIFDTLAGRARHADKQHGRNNVAKADAE
ncbi:MAG TPA: hypothetical protein VL550_04655 [Rhodocyclaceae bacterium]|nr:hypothetical protein [Rhodocyclaceae bacterium]